MKWIAFFAAALALAGCVGNRVELGGMERPLLAPSTAVACDNAGLKLVSRGPIVISEDVIFFFSFAGAKTSLEQMKIGYDVNQAGEPVNIRYVGPPAAMKHGTRQKMIRSAVNALEGSLYAWPGQSGFATGCTYNLNILLQLDGPQDAGKDSASSPS